MGEVLINMPLFDRLDSKTFPPGCQHWVSWRCLSTSVTSRSSSSSLSGPPGFHTSGSTEYWSRSSGIIYIFGFRILSSCPDPGNDFNPTGVVEDHQGGIFKIFLWSPNQRLHSFSWKDYARLPSQYSDDCTLRDCLHYCEFSVKCGVRSPINV